jgi:hypothetical protein
MIGVLKSYRHKFRSRKAIAGVDIERDLSETDFHLKKSLKWFQTTLLKTGGSAAKFSLLTRSYASGYPETTGYWINTLVWCQARKPEIYKEVFGSTNVGLELGNWLLNVQRRDQTFPGSFGDFKNQPPRVFNTGQILLGLLVCRTLTNDSKFDVACREAGDWLVKVQDTDGCWKEFTNCQYSSNTRTAWALIQLGLVTDEKKYIESGKANLDFAVRSQTENGYFINNGFVPDKPAFTHTIAYAIDGLLQSGILLGNESWIQSAEKGLKSLIPLVKADGFLSGKLSTQLSEDGNFTCLTGNCQLAIDFFLLAHIRKSDEYNRIGLRLLHFAMKHQLKSDDHRISGGISGSWPLNGEYNGLEIPNWASKFFVDALLASEFAMDRMNG